MIYMGLTANPTNICAEALNILSQYFYRNGKESRYRKLSGSNNNSLRYYTPQKTAPEAVRRHNNTPRRVPVQPSYFSPNRRSPKSINGNAQQPRASLPWGYAWIYTILSGRMILLFVHHILFSACWFTVGRNTVILRNHRYCLIVAVLVWYAHR